MKNTFVALLILASSAVATTGTEARYPAYPRVGGHSVTELCDAGSTFKTKVPVLQCSKWNMEAVVSDQSVENQWKCMSYVSDYKEVSKQYQTQCGQGSTPDCVETIKTYGNTFDVAVYVDNAEYGPVKAGTTTYTIPACK